MTDLLDLSTPPKYCSLCGFVLMDSQSKGFGPYDIFTGQRLDPGGIPQRQCPNYPSGAIGGGVMHDVWQRFPDGWGKIS